MQIIFTVDVDAVCVILFLFIINVFCFLFLKLCFDIYLINVCSLEFMLIMFLAKHF